MTITFKKETVWGKRGEGFIDYSFYDGFVVMQIWAPLTKSQCTDSFTRVTVKARGHLVLLLVMIGNCLDEWAVRAVSSKGQSPSPWAALELLHVLMYTTSSQGVSYCKFWIYWVGLDFALKILIFLYFNVAM